MTRTQTKRFLAIFFAVYFGAVFLRVDYFPLSWVPMYGLHKPKVDLTVGVGDKAVRNEGFIATRANGDQIRISARHLNVPNANFRRLFTQRAFNNGPPQHDRERVALIGFNRWWYETLVGEDPRKRRNYSGTLLDSVNRTLGYGLADPKRIVRLESQLDFARFTRAQLDSGDLVGPAVERRVAIISPQGTIILSPQGSRVVAGFRSGAGNKGVDSVE